MRPSKSLLSILSLTMALSATVRAEEILPPYGAEVAPAQGAAGGLSIATTELTKQTNLFVRKNGLGNPQNPATIHPYYRQAFDDARNMVAAAQNAKNSIGGPNAYAAYDQLKNTFLSLNTSIRSMKNSGLKEAQETGVAFEGVRNGFENVRGYFISRWKNRAGVEMNAANAVQAAQYSVERLKALLETGAPNVPGDGAERSRAVIAQIRVIRDDVQLFQAHIAQNLRDPRSSGLQSVLNEFRTSVQILQQLSSRWSVRPEVQAETASVSQAVSTLDSTYMLELQ